jgi:hypothetical protein
VSEAVLASPRCKLQHSPLQSPARKLHGSVRKLQSPAHKLSSAQKPPNSPFSIGTEQQGASSLADDGVQEAIDKVASMGAQMIALEGQITDAVLFDQYEQAASLQVSWLVRSAKSLTCSHTFSLCFTFTFARSRQSCRS